MVAAKSPLTVVWISDYPVEWMADVPDALKHLQRRHPATWAMVLLAEYEKNPDLKIHVVLFRGDIPEDFVFVQNGVTYHVLKASPRARLATFFWLDTLRIKKVCERIKPDLIHAWGSEKGASLIASRLRWPYVMTIQGLFAWYKQRMKLPRYDRFVGIVERISLGRARVVTTESDFAVQFLKDNFPKPSVHQAEHAPNHCFRNVQRQPCIMPLEFVAVGGLGHRKGTDMILAALDRLSGEMDYRMKFITNPQPEYIQSLRAAVSEKTWQRIEFKHHLPPDKVAKELETATMLLMPTRADTSPNAVKEAVVAGLPVVAASVGGIPDYVVHDKNGLLFPSGDQQAFEGALRAACKHPLFGQGRVDTEVWARKREYLSPELMAGKFLAAYKAALAIGR